MLNNLTCGFYKLQSQFLRHFDKDIAPSIKGLVVFTNIINYYLIFIYLF